MEGQERQLPSDRGSGLLGNHHGPDEAYFILHELPHLSDAAFLKRRHTGAGSIWKTSGRHQPADVHAGIGAGHPVGCTDGTSRAGTELHIRV